MVLHRPASGVDLAASHASKIADRQDPAASERRIDLSQVDDAAQDPADEGIPALARSDSVGEIGNPLDIGSGRRSGR